MRRVTLLYNPFAGKPVQRAAVMESIAEALRRHDVEVAVIATEGPGTAGTQAASANADILFACGGDGTVHEIIQGLAYHPSTALGILPLGSANVLARHLKLSTDPFKAALQQLRRKAEAVPLGRVTYQTISGEQSRYFLAMAGAGPDGALVYKMLSAQKHRFGRAAYYLHAASLFCGERFSSFLVTCTTPSGEVNNQRAVSAMTVRVGDLGGLFSPLVRGGEICHPHIQLTLIKPPAPTSLAAWFILSWVRQHGRVRCTSILDVSSFHCSEGEVSPIQVQADGEWLGQTPMTVTLVPNALRLLVPD